MDCYRRFAQAKTKENTGNSRRLQDCKLHAFFLIEGQVTLESFAPFFSSLFICIFIPLHYLCQEQGGLRSLEAGA